MKSIFKNEVAALDLKSDESDDPDNDGDSYDPRGLVESEEEVYEYDGDADSLVMDLNDVENVIEYQFSSASESVSQSHSRSVPDLLKASQYMSNAIPSISQKKKELKKMLSPECPPSAEELCNSPFAGSANKSATATIESVGIRLPLEEPLLTSEDSNKVTPTIPSASESIAVVEEASSPVPVTREEEATAILSNDEELTVEQVESARLAALLVAGGFCSPVATSGSGGAADGLPLPPAPTPVDSSIHATSSSLPMEKMEDMLRPPPMLPTAPSGPDPTSKPEGRRQSVGDRRR